METLVKQVNKMRAENIVIGDTESVSHTIQPAIMGDAVSINDNMIVGLGKARYLLDTIVLSDTISKTVRALNKDSVSMPDYTGDIDQKQMKDTINMSDVIVAGKKYMTLRDSVINTDILDTHENVSNLFTEYVSASDSLAQELRKVYFESLTVNDDLVGKFIESVSTFILTLDMTPPVVKLTMPTVVNTHVPFNVILQSDKAIASYTAYLIDGRGSKITATSLVIQNNQLTGLVDITGAHDGTGVFFVSITDVGGNTKLARQVVDITTDTTDLVEIMTTTVSEVTMAMTIEKVIK
jgi:hypothetical protein